MKSTCFLSCPWAHQETGLTWGLNLWSGGGHLYGGNSPIPNEVLSLPCWCTINFPLRKIYWKWFWVWFGFPNWWKDSNSLFWKSVPCYGRLQQARKLQTQWHPHKDWENISAASWRLVQENMRHIDVIIITHTCTEPFSRGLKSTLQTLSTTTLLWGRYDSPLLCRRSQGRERCFSSPYFQKAACTFGGSKMKSQEARPPPWIQCLRFIEVAAQVVMMNQLRDVLRWQRSGGYCTKKQWSLLQIRTFKIKARVLEL